MYRRAVGRTVWAVALCALGCASSSASVTLPVADVPDVPDVPPVDTGPNLDDPTVRVACPPGQGDPCGPGRHCIAVGPGFLGLCVRDGARGGLCRQSETLPCDESIRCMEGWCARNEHFGPRTRCSGVLCALDEGCVEVLGALQCLRHGAAGGYCRQVGSACDPGSTCDGAGNNRSRCGTELGLGERCAATGRALSFCGAGLACVALDGGATGVCTPIGGEGAPCIAGASCLSGLECQIPVGLPTARCVRALRPGDVCDNVTRGSVRCAQGSNCVGTPTGRCVPDGAYTGQCRVEPPRCDAELRCHRDAPVCVTVREAGQPCDAGSRTHDCADETSCASVDGASRCVPDGARGGRCRTSLSPCDGALACSASLRCVTVIPVGARCEEANSTTEACARGASCVGAAGEAVCVRDGSLGGLCWSGECDEGLVCAEDAFPPQCVRP